MTGPTKFFAEGGREPTHASFARPSMYKHDALLLLLQLSSPSEKEEDTEEEDDMYHLASLAVRFAAAVDATTDGRASVVMQAVGGRTDLYDGAPHTWALDTADEAVVRLGTCLLKGSNALRIDVSFGDPETWGLTTADSVLDVITRDTQTYLAAMRDLNRDLRGWACPYAEDFTIKVWLWRSSRIVDTHILWYRGRRASMPPPPSSCGVGVADIDWQMRHLSIASPLLSRSV